MHRMPGASQAIPRRRQIRPGRVNSLIHVSAELAALASLATALATSLVGLAVLVGY